MGKFEIVSMDGKMRLNRKDCAMNIEKELQDLAERKAGNTEMAFFREAGEWQFSFGNPTTCVMLGEVSGEFEVSGDSLEDVIAKMKQRLVGAGESND